MRSKPSNYVRDLSASSQCATADFLQTNAFYFNRFVNDFVRGMYINNLHIHDPVVTDEFFETQQKGMSFEHSFGRTGGIR